MATADSKFGGQMYAIPAYMVFWLPFLGVQAARARTGKSLFARGPTVLGNFDLSTPNLVH